MGSSEWIEAARQPRPGCRVRVFAAAAALATAAALPAGAGSASGGFRVTVDLATDNKVVAQCDRISTPATDGSAVNVTCVDNQTSAASTPATRTDPRFLLQLQRGGGTIGTVEGLVPPGTVASWRVVNGADRDYLEIVVGW